DRHRLPAADHGRRPGRARRAAQPRRPRRQPGPRRQRAPRPAGGAVNAEALPADWLACLLYDAAEGICADIAAVMLIDRHGHFLHDPAFRRIIAAGSSITTGQPLAVIRWTAAIGALDAGQLPCSSSD